MMYDNKNNDNNHTNNDDNNYNNKKTFLEQLKFICRLAMQ